MLCGAMDTKKFSEDLWGETYKNVDVVVLTAQILLDLFHHGFVQMSRVRARLEFVFVLDGLLTWMALTKG